MRTDLLIDWLRPVPFRGKARLLKPFVPMSGERDAEVFGYRVRLDLRDFIQRMIWLGDYERRDTRRVAQLLRPGMTFVDVGANVGYFSLLAASRVGPRGRVLSFEPSPYAYGRLVETCERNGISQVEVLQAGLADVPGSLPLQITPGIHANHTPSLVRQEGATELMVPIRTLADVLRGIDRVDVMKIDVEGFELKVLAGGADLLRAGVVRRILVEVSDPWLRRAGASAGQLCSQLRILGFRDESRRPDPGFNQVENRWFVFGG